MRLKLGAGACLLLCAVLLTGCAHREQPTASIPTILITPVPWPQPPVLAPCDPNAYCNHQDIIAQWLGTKVKPAFDINYSRLTRIREVVNGNNPVR